MSMILPFFVLIYGLQAPASFQNETVPYSVLGGSIDGMKIIADLPKGNGFSRVGVHKGDIVLLANGEIIQDRQTAEKLYNSGSIQSVSILRQGALINLRIQK